MNTAVVTIEGEELVIRIRMTLPPVPSSSGKTLVVASTHGNIYTGVQVDGKEVQLGVNAYIHR
jgi:hypothetical protein